MRFVGGCGHGVLHVTCCRSASGVITWCDGGVLQVLLVSDNTLCDDYLVPGMVLVVLHVHLVSEHVWCDDYLVWFWCFCSFIWCDDYLVSFWWFCRLIWCDDYLVWFWCFCRLSGVVITWYGVGVFAGSSGVGAHLV